MAETRHYPSSVEHTGYYNIPPYEEDPGYVHCSVKDVPPFDFDECMDLSRLVEKCLKKASAEVPAVPNDYLDKAPWAINDDIEDRTLPVELDDLRLLTPALIRCVQHQALPKQPLWRILFVGEDLDTGVLIYPKVVRVGDVPQSCPLDKALRRVVAKIQAIREARDGPMQRQIAYVCRQMPTLVGNLGRSPVCVAAVFDTGFQAERKRITVWLLHRGKNPWSYEAVKPAEEYGKQLRVGADGSCSERRIDDRSHRKGESWCTAWFVPKATREIAVVGPTEFGLKPRRCILRINPEEFVKDADLKEMGRD